MPLDIVSQDNTGTIYGLKLDRKNRVSKRLIAGVGYLEYNRKWVIGGDLVSIRKVGRSGVLSYLLRCLLWGIFRIGS
jgi:hypothetical protein